MEFFHSRKFRTEAHEGWKIIAALETRRLEHGPEICSPLKSFEREMKPFLAPLERSNTHRSLRNFEEL